MPGAARFSRFNLPRRSVRCASQSRRGCATAPAVRDTVPVETITRHLLSLASIEANEMSEVKQQARYTGVDRRAPRADVAAGKPGGRHAAITNSLYNWHNYKNWAEKAR